MASALNIRAFRPEDLPATLRLLQAAFGTWPRNLDGQDAEEFFRWKHMTSPFGRSLLLVAEKDGGIVGFAAWLRWTLIAGGRTIEALRGVDVAVDPNFRRQGIHVSMVREASSYFPRAAALTFSTPNRQSHSGTLTSGRQDVGRCVISFRAPTPLRSAIKLMAKTQAASSLQTRFSSDAESAVEVLREGDGVNELIAEMEHANGLLATSKDLEYLRWRYGSLRGYRVVRVHRQGRLAGMAILRVRRRGPLQAAVISELLVRREDHLIARELLRRAVRAAPVDLVLCHFPVGSTPARAATRCGFIPSRSGPRVTTKSLHEGIVPDPNQRGSWALSLGDLDLL